MNVVIGEGWAALVTVSSLIQAQKPVTWLSGSETRLLPPLPALDCGAEVWKNLAAGFGIPTEVSSGSYLREFRGKSFREAPWCAEPEEKNALWEVDRLWASFWVERCSEPIGELEEEIRKAIRGMETSECYRRSDIPVIGIEEKEKIEIILADQSRVFADHVFNASQSILKPGPKKTAGVLQVQFEHTTPIGLGIEEGFCGALSREPGESVERRIWGYFSSTGLQSTWSVCFSPEESENNHEISKKLRRMKNLLDKMFVGEPWMKEGQSFLTSLKDERVRFEEKALCLDADSESLSASRAGSSRVIMLRDGQGPGKAACLARDALQDFGISLDNGTSHENKRVNFQSPSIEQFSRAEI